MNNLSTACAKGSYDYPGKYELWPGGGKVNISTEIDPVG
jgi:hypothetical protein